MPTILLVDDDPAMRALVRAALAITGAEFVEAADGSRALELVESHRPDVIVLDWMMPVVSGLEVVQALRANPATAEVPVVVLTVRSGDEDRAAMQALGVEEYLTKPFSPLRLLAAVRRVLGRGHAGSAGHGGQVVMDDVDDLHEAVATMQGKIRALLDALEAADAERGLLLRATDLLLRCWERDYDAQGLRNAAACVDLAIAAAGDHAATAGHLRRAVEYLRRGAGGDDVTRGE